MSDVRLFSDRNLGMQVRMILHEDASISINAEDAAKGFGFTTVARSGNKRII